MFEKNANQAIKEIDIYAVKEQFLNKKTSYLIDVREISEWQQGHLPNAIHLSLDIIQNKITEEVPDKTAEIILYCAAGYRSALAADYLQKLGYQNVASMEGGFNAWRAIGFAFDV